MVPISNYIQFSSLSELVEKVGFDVRSIEDFKVILGDDCDQYIRTISNFNDWNSMLVRVAEV